MPIELVPVETSLNGLVGTGLSNRPELKEAQCLVAEAVGRLRREQAAPLVPSVLLGMNYGGFGGGLGDTVAQFHDHAEFNALARGNGAALERHHLGQKPMRSTGVLPAFSHMHQLSKATPSRSYRPSTSMER